MRLKGYSSTQLPVPIGVQNLVIRDYCRRRGHEYSMSDVEFLQGHHVLQGMVWYIHEFDGICAYSMACLPADEELRDLILEAYSDKEIHLALEGYVLPRDRTICETIWKLKEIINDSPAA